MPDDDKDLDVKDPEEVVEVPSELEDAPDIDLGLKPEEVPEEVKEREDKKEEKPPEPTVKEKELEERLSRMEGDKKNLQKALHEARQEKKAKPKEPEVFLTDAEIVKIMEEHGDDKQVLFNALTYKAKQVIKEGKKDVINDIEVKTRQKDINAFMQERIKDGLNDESSPVRGIINRAKTDFFLEDHPLADFLGAAAAAYINLPNILKEQYELTKKEVLGDKADESRKKDIKASQVGSGGSKLPPGKSGNGGLTADQLDTAKRLGLNTPAKLKIYETQLLRGRTPNA